MARPRAATDEQIIEAAEKLAAEIGWQNVYAKTVYESMGVGGSLSTFSKTIKAWRAEKEESAGSEKTDVAEIVEDRASVLDEGLSAIADTLKKLRDTVNAEIDRAVSDERRKSERLRADDRAAHEKAIQDLRGQIDALSAEIDDLAAEASSEGDRADAAESKAEELSARLADALNELGELQERVQVIPGLEQQINDLTADKEALASEAAAQIEKAEAREAVAIDEVKKRDDRITGIEAKAVNDLAKRDAKIEKLETDLKGKTEDLATARVDLTTARSERTQADEKREVAQNEIDDLKAQVEAERTRADRAWDRVKELEKLITSNDRTTTEMDNDDGKDGSRKES